MREWLPQLVDRAELWIIGRAPLLLLVTAGVVIASLAQLVDIRTGQALLTLDPSIDGILPKEDEDRAYYEDIKHLFSVGEVVLLALVADDIFTFDNLTRIQQISDKIENLDQVERVTSLSLSLNIRSEGGALVTEPFYDIVPRAPAELADLRSRALSDPIYAGNLISGDGRVSLVLAHLLDLPEQEILESRIDDRIREIAEASWGDGEFWMSGGVHVKAEMSRLMLRDSTVVVPIAALIIAAVAFLAFRTLRGVLIPVISVLISTLVTLAFVARAYGSLNQITAAIPSVMIVVGFAYSVHLVSAYYEAVRNRKKHGEEKKSPAQVALGEVATPVLFTGLTTAAGFASLAISSFPSIQQYGTATAFGVVSSMIVSLTVSPALLQVLPIPDLREKPASARIDYSLARLARFDIRNRAVILLIGAAIALFSGLGLTRIVVGSDFVSSFKPDNPVRRDFNHINRHLEGANSFNIVLSTSATDGFKIPQNLHTLDRLQDWLADQPDVGGSTSFSNYIKAIHQGIQGGNRDYYSVPESKNLVSQLLVVGGNDELHQYVDGEFQTTNVVVRTTAMDSIGVSDLVERVEERLSQMPQHIQGRVTGNTVLVSRTMDDIAIGQAKSLATAFIAIYVILSMLFASFKMGLIALIPNALPVLIFFGILGWSGIQLNASTGLIACIVLGIAVDDTIHLLAQFQRSAKRYADGSRGVVESMRRVGKPVTITTAALCLGFGCLVLSEMQPQVEFGYLAAVTLLAAWLVDVTFTPALAASLQVVTIWDALTFHLGENPQRGISLFSELTSSQARIAALSVELVEFAKGHQVIEDGGQGHGVYVVIEGELEASFYRGEEEPLSRTHARGEVVGELAVFRGSRTAAAIATTKVLLLKITEQHLVKLQRRHPLIVEQLYANLEKELDDRLAELANQAAQRVYAEV